MCPYVNPIDTNTTFIILMHPKEFKKVKNGTGHLTHLSLKNSKLFIGVDFTDHKEINEIIDTHDSYILYPSQEALNISTAPIYKDSLHVKRNIAVFIIDSTWSCSLKILRHSRNLQKLGHISFNGSKLSEFKIKQQPREYCLSTIESVLSVLEILNEQEVENLNEESLKKFLEPFYKMIEYQLKCINNPLSNAVRYRKKRKVDFT